MFDFYHIGGSVSNLKAMFEKNISKQQEEQKLGPKPKGNVEKKDTTPLKPTIKVN